MELKEAMSQYIKHKAETKTSTKRLVNELGTLLAPMYAEAGMEIPLQSLNDILIDTSTNQQKQEVVDYGILNLILCCQCMFYLLGNENDEKIVDWYHVLYEDHVKFYEDFMRGARERIDEEMKSMLTMNFQVDPSKSLAHNVRELDKFAEAAKITIKTTYKCFEQIFDEILVESNEKGIMVFWIFNKDVIGNEREWYNTVKYWLECYYIYKEYQSLNKKKSELVRRLMGVDKFEYLNLTDQDMPNSIHKVDKYIHEANRLIARAKRGTFPV